jgi:MSHA biogenesis protein MshP
MKKLQHGFSIITAIFLLVVLSFLGIAMVTLSTSQHQSAAMDVMGSRAYQAARAGIEWQAFFVVNSVSNAAVAVPECLPNNPLGNLGGTLSSFAVTVNCAAASHVEGASTIWIYDVSAVACTEPPCPRTTAPSANYVERVISVKMGK